MQQDAHVRELSRICGTRNTFTSLIKHELHMRIISVCTMIFYDAKELPLKEVSHERS